MTIPITLDNFLGNAGAVEILKRAIEQNRLPHAMIFAGPAGVGKCTLALLVAQYLNCPSPTQDGACGNCSTCKRILAVVESRHLACRTLKGEGFCGNCPNCRMRAKWHPDIRLIEPQAKTTISIDQVRELINEISFQPLEARYRVVILDPAEQMRLEAHNSLLKTLEEPPSRTIMILVTTNAYLLLETIRSRARILQFGEIPQSQIERYLISNRGKTIEEASFAAALSGGSLAAALDFGSDGYTEIRKQAIRFVHLLLMRGNFSEMSGIAAQVTKDKQVFQLWIDSVALLLEDIYYAGLATERVAQRDLMEDMVDLSRSVSRSALVRAIEGVRRLKSGLRYNVNRQLALESMFVELV